VFAISDWNKTPLFLRNKILDAFSEKRGPTYYTNIHTTETLDVEHILKQLLFFCQWVIIDHTNLTIPEVTMYMILIKRRNYIQVHTSNTNQVICRSVNIEILI